MHEVHGQVADEAVAEIDVETAVFAKGAMQGDEHHVALPPVHGVQVHQRRVDLPHLMTATREGALVFATVAQGERGGRVVAVPMRCE